MILLHFRLYKGKKTPLLRKHSICSEPQRCCFIFFLLLHAVSFYHRKVLLLCPLPLMKYCSSFLFSLLRPRFLPGTGFSRPAQNISERLFVSSGGFLTAFKVKVCWHCASVAKMDGAVLGRSKAQITGRSARPPPQ